MIQVQIVIPSRGRHDTITTHKHVSNAIICVAESEKQAYQDHNPDAVIVCHPDSVKGITLKRQWIYDRWGNVFMLDDDLEGLCKMTVRNKRLDRYRLTGDESYDVIQYGANMAALCGCHLFGFNSNPRTEHYFGHRPFDLAGYVSTAAMGLLATGKEHLRFNPEIKLNNDFYMSALNAFFYRRCFIDRRFSILQKSSADAKGGNSFIRTTEAERQDFERLKHFFGPAIQPKSSKHNEFAKKLMLPF